MGTEIVYDAFEELKLDTKCPIGWDALNRAKEHLKTYQYCVRRAAEEQALPYNVACMTLIAGYHVRAESNLEEAKELLGPCVKDVIKEDERRFPPKRRAAHTSVAHEIVYVYDEYTPEDARKKKFCGPNPQDYHYYRIDRDGHRGSRQCTLRRTKLGKLIGGRAPQWGAYVRGKTDHQNRTERRAARQAIADGKYEGLGFRSPKIQSRER